MELLGQSLSEQDPSLSRNPDTRPVNQIWRAKVLRKFVLVRNARVNDYDKDGLPIKNKCLGIHNLCRYFVYVKICGLTPTTL